jgi:hypothetical protein
MKIYYFLILIPILFAGCFNDRGISLRYYNDCEEYYDAQGYYHKKCDKNLIDYKEIQNNLKTVKNPEHGSVE